MSKASYKQDLRSNVRLYWNEAIVKTVTGDLTNNTVAESQFSDRMFETIDRGLTNAWQEGSKRVGIQPDEISPTEQIKLM